MPKKSFYIVNIITGYRLLSVILLSYFLATSKLDLFKWFLAFSFFTDAIDGALARYTHTTSIFGSRLDSIADDCIVLIAIAGIIVTHPEFIRENIVACIVLVSLYILQVAMSFIRYGKMSSFHTYAAKCAAISQACFLILFFFLKQAPVVLFYLAFSLTVLDLIEEIILVALLPKWRANVKGIFWIRE